MNGTVVVLLIAGVFVVAGVALIAVAVMLGRQKEDESEPSSPATNRTPGGGRGRTFIDEPLETDLGTQLGTNEAQPSTPTSHRPGLETPSASAPRTVVGRREGREAWDPETIPESIRAAGSGPRKASYDFRVQLAYRAFTAGEFERAATELRGAFALTDDPDARAELLIEIGNSSRMGGDFSTARSAYQDAITYSTDPLVWDNLHHWIEEVTAEEKSAMHTRRQESRQTTLFPGLSGVSSPENGDEALAVPDSDISNEATPEAGPESAGQDGPHDDPTAETEVIRDSGVDAADETGEETDQEDPKPLVPRAPADQQRIPEDDEEQGA